MATYVLKDSQIRLGGVVLTSDVFNISFGIKVDAKEDTVFGLGTHRNTAGLLDAEVGYQGYVQLGVGLVDETQFLKLASLDEILSVCPQDGNAGSIAYLLKAVQSEYSPGAGVGEMYAFSAKASPSGSPPVRATILENGAKTVTGNGTGRQLGAVTAVQKLWAALHVTAVSGTATPTITVKVQSDDNSGFTTPTDRITFAAKTTIGAEMPASVAGPITDDWWRMIWTVSGTTPSLTIFGAVGIAAA